MLGKPCLEKGGVGGGLQAQNPTFNLKPPTPPNLPLYQTPKLSTLRAQRGGTGSVLADNLAHTVSIATR